MSREKTLCIIKPDAIEHNHIGDICQSLENEGLTIIAARMMIINKDLASEFYSEHLEKPFFGNLLAYMCDAPSLPMVLEGENAVVRYRTLLGATNPQDAAPGTLRKRFSPPPEQQKPGMLLNAVHGSENLVSACREIALFFSDQECFSRQ
ncbi:MAG: nucleoside-diphosphate kinase [Candidatus Eutrophobiaceae bacterium]